MTQKEMREFVVMLHNDLGISLSSIARKAEISCSMISLWVKEKRNLSTTTERKLTEYIDEMKPFIDKM